MSCQGYRSMSNERWSPLTAMNLGHGVLPFPQLHSGSSNRTCPHWPIWYTNKWTCVCYSVQWMGFLLPPVPWCYPQGSSLGMEGSMVFKVPQLCGSPGKLRASSLNFIWSCPAKPQINVCFTTFIIVCVKYSVSVDALCKGVCWKSKDNFQGGSSLPWSRVSRFYHAVYFRLNESFWVEWVSSSSCLMPECWVCRGLPLHLVFI